MAYQYTRGVGGSAFAGNVGESVLVRWWGDGVLTLLVPVVSRLEMYRTYVLLARLTKVRR